MIETLYTEYHQELVGWCRTMTGNPETAEELPEQQQYPEEMIALEWEMLLNTLPDQEGVIVSLRYLQGYTSSQIGKILSLPPGTVRYKLSSARKHILKALGGNYHVE